MSFLSFFLFFESFLGFSSGEVARLCSLSLCFVCLGPSALQRVGEALTLQETLALISTGETGKASGGSMGTETRNHNQSLLSARVKTKPGFRSSFTAAFFKVKNIILKAEEDCFYCSKLL